MCAAARLHVDGAVRTDHDQSNATRSARWLHRERAHEPRIGIELSVGDPTLADRMVRRDQGLQVRRQTILVDRAGVLNVEVETPVFRADLTAGDGEFHQAADKMQCGVHAHVAQPRVPIERNRHGLAHGRLRRSFRRDVDDHGLVGHVIDRCRDRTRSASKSDHTLVARLPARAGVEWRAIKHDPATLIDGKHSGTDLLEVRVGAVELFGHGTCMDRDRPHEQARCDRSARTQNSAKR